MQRRFPLDGILFRSGYIYNKVAIWHCGKHVLRPKNFCGEGPQHQLRTFYAPIGTHQVAKFGAIPPTDPDDISQRTPDFWPIFEFQGLKIVGGRPIPNEVCISKRFSSSLYELQNF